METSKKTIVERVLHTAASLHVREAGAGEEPSRIIEGYAILFGVPSAPLWTDDDSEAREVIDAGAVTKEFLDGCDIKMTMFHNRQLLLARSQKGVGTLSYEVDSKGVKFSFEAPRTADGDKALALVSRGDIAGCSFAFSTYYYDDGFVQRSAEVKDGRTYITYRVKVITDIDDFTLAADPVYQETSVEVRELVSELRKVDASEPDPENMEKMRQQVREMRGAAKRKLL